MQIKSKYSRQALNFVSRMNDIRFVGQLLFVVVVLLISWSGIKTIQTNYGLQKQITSLKQQNELQELQNDNLALQNQYLNSNQYLELAARQDFSLAAPGEKEIIVPQQVALADTVSVPTQSGPNLSSIKEPTYQRDFESWLDFFLHRPDSNN